MLRTQIYLPDDLHRDLTLLAKSEGRTISQLIREGATQVLAEKKRKAAKKKDWRKFIGAVKGGPTDVSSTIDYYLYGEGNPKWGKR